MDCQDLQRFIHPYVDGEFDEEERVELTAHLAICDSCRRVAHFEGRFRERLREQIAPIKAPPALRVRLGQALDATDRRQRWLWGWRLLPASAAVAAMAAGIVFWHRSSSEAALSDFAEATVQSHRQQLPLDVRASKAEPIKRYFAGKVPFAVRPPWLRGGARRHRDARLIGARLSNLRQHQTAYLRYKVNGEPVSVFMLDPHSMPPTQGRVQRVGNRTISWHDVRGYHVALVRDGGTGYAVTSDMDPARLVKLINY